jgi:hypothetical protein
LPATTPATSAWCSAASPGFSCDEYVASAETDLNELDGR